MRGEGGEGGERGGEGRGQHIELDGRPRREEGEKGEETADAEQGKCKDPAHGRRAAKSEAGYIVTVCGIER